MKKRDHTFLKVYFDATRECNLQCPLCMSGSNNPELVRRSREDELSYEEIVRCVLEPAKEVGALQIQYGGGEFLLREDAMDLVRVTAEMGYEPCILTNGVMLDDRLMRDLKKAGGRNLLLVFGVNSISDSQLNKETRDVELDVVLKALDLCEKHTVRRHMVVNIGQHNRKDLAETFDWFTRHSISVNRAPFVPRNSGKEYFDQLAITREAMEQDIHPALLKSVSCCISYTPFFLAPEVHAEVSGGESWNVTAPQNPPCGCWVGSWLAIGADGHLSPCVTMLDSLTAGNVREQSISEIVRTSEIFQKILNRNELSGKCGRCRYNKTCGGCRALAWYHHGDYMAEDPTCFFEPVDETTVSPLEEETNRVFRIYARLARAVGLADAPGKNSRTRVTRR